MLGCYDLLPFDQTFLRFFLEKKDTVHLFSVIELSCLNSPVGITTVFLFSEKKNNLIYKQIWNFVPAATFSLLLNTIYWNHHCEHNCFFNSWSVLIFIYLAFYEQGRSFSIRIWRKYGILFYLIHQTCFQTRIEWDQKWSTNQISFDVRTTIIRTVYEHYVQTNQAFFKLLVLFFLFFFWRLLFKIFPLAIFFVPSLNFFLHITIFVKSSSLTFSVTHLYWFALISFGLTHFLIH